MAVPGTMELTIKINQFPDDAREVKNGWQEFTVAVDGQEVRITVRPKMFNKLRQAQADWPQWVASITGTMGPKVPKGFILAEPAVQTFERKPKPPADTPPAAEAPPAEAVPA